MTPEPLSVPREIQSELENIFQGASITPTEKNIYSIRDQAYHGSSFPVDFSIDIEGDQRRCIYKPVGDYSDRMEGFNIVGPQILRESEFVTDSVICEIPFEALSLGSFVNDRSVPIESSLSRQLMKEADRFLEANPDLHEQIDARFPTNRHCAFVLVSNSGQLVFIL